MTYAVICRARKARKFGVHFLALIDRSAFQHRFWTSDGPEEILRIYKKSEAHRIRDSLKYNNPEVVSFDEARRIINEQKQIMEEMESHHLHDIETVKAELHG